MKHCRKRKISARTNFEKKNINEIDVTFDINLFISKYHHRHHQRVLPKGTSFTANSGTKPAVLPKGRPSTANSEPRLQLYIIIIITIIIRVFCPNAGPSLQAEKPRLQFCRRQVFHRKLRNQGCNLTRDLIRALASRCFPHPTLSLASEQTLKDLKSSQGTNEEVSRVDLANWALRTSPKFATGVKYQFHQGFFYI